jgi:hypothetical protein
MMRDVRRAARRRAGGSRCRPVRRRGDFVRRMLADAALPELVLTDLRSSSTCRRDPDSRAASERRRSAGKPRREPPPDRCGGWLCNHRAGADRHASSYSIRSTRRTPARWPTSGRRARLAGEHPIDDDSEIAVEPPSGQLARAAVRPCADEKAGKNRLHSTSTRTGAGGRPLIAMARRRSTSGRDRCRAGWCWPTPRATMFCVLTRVAPTLRSGANQSAGQLEHRRAPHRRRRVARGDLGSVIAGGEDGAASPAPQSRARVRAAAEQPSIPGSHTTNPRSAPLSRAPRRRHMAAAGRDASHRSGSCARVRCPRSIEGTRPVAGPDLVTSSTSRGARQRRRPWGRPSRRARCRRARRPGAALDLVTRAVVVRERLHAVSTTSAPQPALPTASSLAPPSRGASAAAALRQVVVPSRAAGAVCLLSWRISDRSSHRPGRPAPARSSRRPDRRSRRVTTRVRERRVLVQAARTRRIAARCVRAPAVGSRRDGAG